MVASVMDVVLKWVGPILTLMGFVLSVYLFKRGKKSKRIEYLVATVAPLIYGSNKFNLEVSFRSKVVSNPTLVVLRLGCSGGLPVEKSDFESPITVAIGGIDRILSFELTNRVPNDLNVEAELVDKRLIIAPLLLNPGDLAEIQLLVEGTPSSIGVSSRIVGIPAIKRISPPYPPGTGPGGDLQRADRVMYSFFGVMFAVLIVLAWVATITTILAKVIMSASVVGIGVVFYAFMWRKLKRARFWAGRHKL